MFYFTPNFRTEMSSFTLNITFLIRNSKTIQKAIREVKMEKPTKEELEEMELSPKEKWE